MSPLSIVPNLVIGFVSKPVGEGPVLALLLGQPLLHQQGLVRSHVVLNIINLINYHNKSKCLQNVPKAVKFYQNSMHSLYV